MQMSNLDKLLTEFKDAEKKCSDSFGLNEIANYEYEAFSVNNSGKLIKIIEVIRDALSEIKANGHSDLCQVMKPVRPSYRCTFEEADEALQQAEQIAGE